MDHPSELSIMKAHMVCLVLKIMAGQKVGTLLLWNRFRFTLPSRGAEKRGAFSDPKKVL